MPTAKTSAPRASAPSLFDVIAREEAREHPEECRHARERRTETQWPEETFKRLTMTCEHCGRIRGRFPGE